MSVSVSSRNHWRLFPEVSKEQGAEPRRQYSGKFNLRIPPELHEKLAMTVVVQGRVSTRSLRKHSNEVSRQRRTDNIQMQKAGAVGACLPCEHMPASDLGR